MWLDDTLVSDDQNELLSSAFDGTVGGIQSVHQSWLMTVMALDDLDMAGDARVALYVRLAHYTKTPAGRFACYLMALFGRVSMERDEYRRLRDLNRPKPRLVK